MSYVLSFMSFQEEPFAPLKFLKKNLVPVPNPKHFFFCGAAAQRRP